MVIALIIWSAILLCAVVFHLWLDSKHGKHWLKGMDE